MTLRTSEEFTAEKPLVPSTEALSGDAYMTSLFNNAKVSEGYF